MSGEQLLLLLNVCSVASFVVSKHRQIAQLLYDANVSR